MDYPKFSVSRKIVSTREEKSTWPSTSGVYVISTDNIEITRALGTDINGILYIGQSKDLKARVRSFLTSNHNVTWFFFCNKQLAKKLISSEITDEDESILEHVSKLNVRYAETASPKHYERLAIWSYMDKFGEVPPLNSSVPKKDEVAPNSKSLEWFSSQFS